MNLREFFIVSNWWGKILGAFFGYLIARAPGALVGILVGNVFDRGLASHFANPHWLYHSEKQQVVQDVFFESTFSVMGYIAKADGRVSEHELNMAKQLMHEMRLSKEQTLTAKRLFNEAKDSNFQVDEVLTHLKTVCKGRRELLKLFLDIQYRAAQVDGLSQAKLRALDKVFTLLGFVPLHAQYHFYENFTRDSFYNKQQKQEGNHSTVANSVEQAYALLGLEPSANKQEVKRAYRQAISRNHPDKLIAQGLPQAMIKMANEKTQAIVRAYTLICENKGW